MINRRPLLLDGGMGKTLLAQGAPFCADVTISSNDAVVPFHLGDERFEKRGAELTVLAGQMARSSADAVVDPVVAAGSCWVAFTPAEDPVEGCCGIMPDHIAELRRVLD